MSERKEYTGDSVYERAQKFLNDDTRGDKDTSQGNTHLADKVKATGYLKKLRNSEAITRDDETRKAQLELMNALESGVINPTNYLDGGSYSTGEVNFGGESGGKLTYTKFHNQKGFYKMNGGRASETVNITNTQTGGEVSVTNDKLLGSLVPGKGSNYEYGMQKENGIITDGKYDTTTGKLIEGTRSWKDGGYEKGKFDKDTGNLIEGELKGAGGVLRGKFDVTTRILIKGEMIRKDGRIDTGTWDKNGSKSITPQQAVPSSHSTFTMYITSLYTSFRSIQFGGVYRYWGIVSV